MGFFGFWQLIKYFSILKTQLSLGDTYKRKLSCVFLFLGDDNEKSKKINTCDVKENHC